MNLITDATTVFVLMFFRFTSSRSRTTDRSCLRTYNYLSEARVTNTIALYPHQSLAFILRTIVSFLLFGFVIFHSRALNLQFWLILPF